MYRRGSCRACMCKPPQSTKRLILRAKQLLADLCGGVRYVCCALCVCVCNECNQQQPSADCSKCTEFNCCSGSIQREKVVFLRLRWRQDQILNLPWHVNTVEIDLLSPGNINQPYNVCLTSSSSCGRLVGSFLITKKPTRYLWFAEAGGHQAARANIQVPLLPALVVRIQSRYPPIQGTDDHKRPVNGTQNKTWICRHLLNICSVFTGKDTAPVLFTPLPFHALPPLGVLVAVFSSSPAVFEQSGWPSSAGHSTPVLWPPQSPAHTYTIIKVSFFMFRQILTWFI